MIEDVLAVENDVVPFDRADVLEQGCVNAFLGDSPRSPRPCDLLACQLASRREDHGQVSIIMSVILDDGGLHNALGHIVRISKIKYHSSLFMDNDMKTVAYLRVSTDSQNLANQKLAILEHARQKHFAVDRFVEVQASSRQGPDQRRSDELLDSLRAGDRLVVSELSRLGRSLGQVIRIVEELVKRKIRFTAIKESIHFEGKQDLQTKVMIALFGLFAEVERDLISERTKEGLAAARAKGRLLGRPKGALGKSKLDGKEEKIRILLQKQVSKTALHHFINSRKLDPKASQPRLPTHRP